MIKSSLENKAKVVNKAEHTTVKPLESIPLENIDTTHDRGIRPNKFMDIVGREDEKRALTIMISSAKKRSEPLDHILFYGPPGLGKTTFAVAIANEVGTSIRVTSGPAIERQGDLAAILTNLKANEILFIDEIHRLPRVVEEILYPAMEDKVLDIVMGKGPSAKTLRINLEPFTLVGATTQIGKISSPMRDRFGLVQRLDYFNNDDLVNILIRASDLWNIKYSKEALLSIAKRSRGTARIALRLLKRVRDFAQSEMKTDEITQEVVDKALNLLGVDEMGLEEIDRRILKIMFKHFNGGPVGLSTLAASVSEDVNTIESVYEPFLMKCGLINRTSRGRMLTESGLKLAIELEGLISMI